MTSSSLPDPFEIWRQALSKLEGEVNSMAGSTANSAEFAQALQQFGGVSRGLQKVFEKALGSYYRRRTSRAARRSARWPMRCSASRPSSTSS